MDHRSSARRKERVNLRRQSQRRLHWRILGFGLFLFLLGFLFGRVVLAAEKREMQVDVPGKETESLEVKSDGERQTDGDAAIVQREQNEFSRESIVSADASEDKGGVKIKTSESEWNLILVNPSHPMPADFEVTLTEVGDGHQVDSRIAGALKDMIAAGKEAGHSIWIASSYRTMEKQTELYENKVAKLRRQGYSEEVARKEAGTVVAIPGTSEHQLGLAVDLVSSEYTGLDERQEQTKSYQWLKEHCAEFGFILRYPNGKTEITGIIYEPWHFRYVGEEAAEEIMEQGICLEEYLEEYPEQNEGD